LLFLIWGVHESQLGDLVRGANDTVVTQVYLSRPHPPNGTSRPVRIYKKRKVHERLAVRLKEEAAACVYRVMQKKRQRDKAILAPHCTIRSGEYRPPFTRNERVRKYEKEDESNQTSSALRKVFLLANLRVRLRRR
jgi:hypothetical protein